MILKLGQIFQRTNHELFYLGIYLLISRKKELQLMFS